MSRPPSRMRPAVGVSKPAMQRRSVVLPQPEGPSSVKNSPRATVTDTSSSARTSAPPVPKRLATSWASTAGPAVNRGASLAGWPCCNGAQGLVQSGASRRTGRRGKGRRATMEPGARHLHLAAKRDQSLVLAEGRGDVDADGEAVGRPVKGKRGGRLARGVEGGAEGGVGPNAFGAQPIGEVVLGPVGEAPDAG